MKCFVCKKQAILFQKWEYGHNSPLLPLCAEHYEKVLKEENEAATPTLDLIYKKLGYETKKNTGFF